MRVALTVVAVLAMATVANGALTMTVSGPTDVGAGLSQYIIGTSGELINGINLKVSGPLNQQWVPFMTSFFDTPTLDNAAFLTATELARDTHVLFENAALQPILYAPQEDNPTPPTGTGTYLGNLGEPTGQRMVFGILAPSDPQNVIQVVVAAGSQFTVDGFVSRADGTEWPVDMTVPEPASLTLLCLGGLALLRRRR
jgi:hypothetical protein